MTASAPASAATSISSRRDVQVAVVVGAGLGDHVGRVPAPDGGARRSRTPPGSSHSRQLPDRVDDPALVGLRQGRGSTAATGSPRSSARPRGRARGRSRRLCGSRGAGARADSGPARGSALAQAVVEAPARLGAVAVADDEQVVGVQRARGRGRGQLELARRRRATRGSARRSRCAPRRSASSRRSCERPRALWMSLSR